MQLLALTCTALLLLCAPRKAAAHELLHEVERGKAIAVKASFSDGEVLAHATAEIYSPADLTLAHQTGRTDKNGWVAFVPDVPGKWRIKIIDAPGHGLDFAVDVDGLQASLARPGSSAGAVPSAAFVLRPLVGLVAIGAIFGMLFYFWRKKESAP